MRRSDMPTGLTAIIHDGDATFEEFVWRCARHMGAFVMMRDDPLDAPIPERFKPSAWNVEQLAVAQAEKLRLEAMSAPETERAAAADYEKAKTEHAKRKADREALRERYERMAELVEKWSPPSPDHIGLKELMATQLSESLDFDCGVTDYDKAPVRLSGPAWLARQMTKADRDIEHHFAANAEEVERTAKRNAWVNALRASVPVPSQLRPKP